MEAGPTTLTVIAVYQGGPFLHKPIPKGPGQDSITTDDGDITDPEINTVSDTTHYHTHGKCKSLWDLKLYSK